MKQTFELTFDWYCTGQIWSGSMVRISGFDHNRIISEPLGLDVTESLINQCYGLTFSGYILFTLYRLFIYGTYYVTFCETSSWFIWTHWTCSAEIWTKLFTMWGWNGKVFYLLLYSIVLRTLLLSILKFHSLTTF